MSTHQNNRYPLRVSGLAIAAGIVLIGGSFIAATDTQHIEALFALAPTVPSGVEVPALDVITEAKKYSFHATIFTIWSTMLLCLPAFCTVWFVRNNRNAGAYLGVVGLVLFQTQKFIQASQPLANLKKHQARVLTHPR